MKQTALSSLHRDRSARMTEYQGWQVPAQFSDPAEEYHAVRTAAGLFDVGFLGRIEVTGAGAEDLLQKVFTRDVTAMTDGTLLYGLLCNDDGFIVDTVLVFRLPSPRSGRRFLVTTNAICTEKVARWLAGHAGADTAITDSTGSLAQIALQGPGAEAVLEAVAGEHFKKIKQKRLKVVTLHGFTLTISRTGFTGERGYEIFLTADRAADLWNTIGEAGKGFGLVPCGMVCREMLRIEAGYLLYGNDIDETRSPLESGQMPFVDMSKEFIGKSALAERRMRGAAESIIGFELLDKGIPRPGGTIFSENREIGTVTSGIHSPHRRRDIGLGYVTARYAQQGQEVEIEVKDREIAAKIVDLPFFRKK